MKINSILVITALATAIASAKYFPADPSPVQAKTSINRNVKTHSYQDIIELFNEIGYTAENWQAGIREVPRILLTSIPKRWQKQAQTIPVKEKKTIFFRLMGSGILIANETILEEREKLLDALKKSSWQTQAWIRALAKKYKVIKTPDETLDTDKLEELLDRVDVIPPSLALAQAAEESGWGTSRFAVTGNSLFGQWDFSGKGIKPERQRKSLGNYGIASFETPQDSVDAYMLNLNTHSAYRKLRARRSELREQGAKISGWELAKTLDSYSERGSDYIKSLHAIMKHNRLMEADEAYLWDKETIIISPLVRPGSG